MKDIKEELSFFTWNNSLNFCMKVISRSIFLKPLLLTKNQRTANSWHTFHLRESVLILKIKTDFEELYTCQIKQCPSWNQ